jgi:putative phosphoribosyl transferase
LSDGWARQLSSFRDRVDAGRALAEEVASLDELVRPLVVALPRGGVPVGAEVARRIGAGLRVLPVSKVGAPGQEELAVGAVAPGGVTALNDDVIRSLRLTEDQVLALVARAAARVEAQLGAYSSYQGGGLPDLSGRSVVVVDDGLATGATMRAALAAVREKGPDRVVLAVPVAPPNVLNALAPLVDEVACPLRPPYMQAVGSWYDDFTQTSDAEVVALLEELAEPPEPSSGAAAGSG